MAKIPAELIDMEELADLVVARLSGGIIGEMQSAISALSDKVDQTDANHTVLLDGLDGLRVALADWANASPPQEPK